MDSWIHSDRLIEFFGHSPVRDDELWREEYEISDSQLKCQFAIEQPDRFAEIKLFHLHQSEHFLHMLLPSYARIEINEDKLVIIPPENGYDIQSSGAVIICPVELIVAPSIRLIFARR